MNLLPTDLLQAIVEGFIDVGDVCVVDIACCNRVLRPEWLILLSKAKLLGKKRTEEDHKHLRGCLQWTATRNAMLSPFYVDQGAMARAMEQLSPGTRLHRIVDLEFMNDHSTPDQESLTKCMKMFPQLRSLRINGFNMRAINEQLKALEAVPVALALNLIHLDDFMLESNVFVKEIRRLGANLQEFSCNVVNDEVLEVLADLRCPLRVIDINTDQVPISNVFANLCAQNVKTLEKIVCGVAENRHFIKHKYVHGILQNTLEAISSDGNRIKILELTVLNCAHAAKYVVAHCPNLQSAQFVDVKDVPHTRLGLIKLANGSFVCDVNAPSQFAEFFAEVQFPIRNLRGSSSWTPYLFLKADELAWLGNNYGGNMESVTLDLTSIRGKSFCQFLSCCPNLTEFCVSCSLKAEVIAILPQLLPKVTKLGLVGDFIENCAECDILTMFEGFRRNDLTYLNLQASDDMTDNVLLKIVDCCPRLQTLFLTDGNFYKQTMFNLIFTKQLKARLIQCDDAEWIEKRLSKFEFEPMPKIFCD